MENDLKIIKEKLRIAALLAINAGFIDAYTFFHYGARFAGAQTGNLVQAGIAFAQGNWLLLGSFLVPIFFFMLGIMLRTVISHFRMKNNQADTVFLVCLQLLLLLFFVTVYIFIFRFSATLVIGILSFIMAIQMNNFTATRGLAYGSIFSTANMRSLAQNFTQFILTKEIKFLKNTRVFLIVITSFFIGSALSTFAQKFLGIRTLYGSAVILILVLVIFKNEQRNLKK